MPIRGDLPWHYHYLSEQSLSGENSLAIGTQQLYMLSRALLNFTGV
jgi:hypothetical protein